MRAPEATSGDDHRSRPSPSRCEDRRCQSCRGTAGTGGSIVKLASRLGQAPALVAERRQLRDPQRHTPIGGALRPAGRRSRQAPPPDDAVPASRPEARSSQLRGDQTRRNQECPGEASFECWTEGPSAQETGLDRALAVHLSNTMVVLIRVRRVVFTTV